MLFSGISKRIKRPEIGQHMGDDKNCQSSPWRKACVTQSHKVRQGKTLE